MQCDSVFFPAYYHAPCTLPWTKWANITFLIPSQGAAERACFLVLLKDTEVGILVHIPVSFLKSCSLFVNQYHRLSNYSKIPTSHVCTCVLHVKRTGRSSSEERGLLIHHKTLMNSAKLLFYLVHFLNGRGAMALLATGKLRP